MKSEGRRSTESLQYAETQALLGEKTNSLEGSLSERMVCVCVYVCVCACECSAEGWVKSIFIWLLRQVPKFPGSCFVSRPSPSVQ